MVFGRTDNNKGYGHQTKGWWLGTPNLQRHMNLWLITLSYKIMWQTTTIIYLLSQCIWLLNLAVRWLTWGAPTHKVTWPLNHLYSRGLARSCDHVISIATTPMAVIIGRVVTYRELPPIKLHDPSIKWSHEVMWYIKCVLSPIALDKQPPSMTWWWLTVRGFHL